MAEPVTALLVMPPEKRSALLGHFTGVRMQVLTASNCREAADRLRAEPGVRVVLSDLSLEDGTWLDVMHDVDQRKAGAKVVVCVHLADERLWVRLIEAGAYDVLVEPYEDVEVKRILESASESRSVPPLAAAS